MQSESTPHGVGFYALARSPGGTKKTDAQGAITSASVSAQQFLVHRSDHLLLDKYVDAVILMPFIRARQFLRSLPLREEPNRT